MSQILSGNSGGGSTPTPLSFSSIGLGKAASNLPVDGTYIANLANWNIIGQSDNPPTAFDFTAGTIRFNAKGHYRITLTTTANTILGGGFAPYQMTINSYFTQDPLNPPFPAITNGSWLTLVDDGQQPAGVYDTSTIQFIYTGGAGEQLHLVYKGFGADPSHECEITGTMESPNTIITVEVIE